VRTRFQRAQLLLEHGDVDVRHEVAAVRVDIGAEERRIAEGVVDELLGHGTLRRPQPDLMLQPQRVDAPAGQTLRPIDE
jgi:hypothetical protein